jgi:hypothetical protein
LPPDTPLPALVEKTDDEKVELISDSRRRMSGRAQVPQFYFVPGCPGRRVSSGPES